MKQAVSLSRRLGAVLVLGPLAAWAAIAAGPLPRGFVIAPPPQLPANALSAAPARGVGTDPTRPPPGMASTPALPAATASLIPQAVTPAGPAAPQAPKPATPVAKPRLQALQLPRTGEASAMVDDQIVRVGERIGEYTLAEIGPDGIVVRHARGKEFWPLVPTDSHRANRPPPAQEREPSPSGTPSNSVAGRKEP